MTHTLGQKEWLKRRQDVKDGKANSMTYFKNVAVTKAGDFVVGLSYNRALERYSCSAIEINGVRDNGKLCTWDKQGKSLDCDLSALNMESVHSDVHII